MSLDERMHNFKFLYDNDGPHLNPHILEKLKPEESSVKEQGENSRLSPELPTILLHPVCDTAAAPQSNNRDNTSTETKAQAPKTKTQDWKKTGKGHLKNNSLPRKKTKKDKFGLQPASQV